MSKDEKNLTNLEYSDELKDKFSNQASHIQADDITTMLTSSLRIRNQLQNKSKPTFAY